MTHLVPASDGVTLHVRTSSGEGAPVVLVHGWMVSSAVWDDFVPQVQGRRVLRPDLRGSGKSPRGTATITLEVLAADVARAIEALGGEPVHLVGHSMGGQLAALVAAVAPERIRSLVLLNPVPLCGVALPDEVAVMFRTSGADRAAQGRILDMACKELSPASRARLLDDAGAIDAAHIAEVFTAWTTGGHVERYGDVKASTLVVSTDDPFLPPDFLRSDVLAKIPGARMVHLPGPGHYPQVERPHETAALLAAHWEGT